MCYDSFCTIPDISFCAFILVSGSVWIASALKTVSSYMSELCIPV